MNNITIRPVAETDAEALARIYNHYITETTVSFETEPITAAEMLRRIRLISACHPYIVIEQEGRVAGYSYVHPWKERAAYCHTLELTIYLDHEARGRGLGSMLIDEILKECKEHTDCHALIASITEENKESMAFHRRHGFEQVSCFKKVGNKFGRWLDVVDMELEIRN